MSGCSERWTAAVVFLALFVCVTSPLPAGPLPATGVLGALAEPDGSNVSLKAVSVQKMASDPPHIVVSDPWAGDIRLIVLLPAPADVLRSQTVDVSGVLTTLPNGYRALEHAAVTAYSDAQGHVIRAPIPPPLAEALPNPFTASPVALLEREIAPLSLRVLTTPPSPVGGDEGEPPGFDPPAQGTIAWAKTRPDSTAVTLAGKVLSRNFSYVSQAAGYFYIQEPWPDTAGLRVAGAAPGSTHPGHEITVTGEMSTLSTGERVLVPTQPPTAGQLIADPRALSAANRTLLCSSLSSAEQGTVTAVGLTGGHGAHLVGTLVSISGRVTSVAQDHFTIWDGSAMWDGTDLEAPGGAPGIRVEMPEEYWNYTPQANDFLEVKGILSLRESGGVRFPVLLVELDLYAESIVTHCDGTTAQMAFLPASVLLPVCQSSFTMRVRLTSCGAPLCQKTVTFTTSLGEFAESQAQTAQAVTSSEGFATVTLQRPAQLPEPNLPLCNTAFVQAHFSGDETHDAAGADGQVTFDRWNLVVTALPAWVVRGNTIPVKATLTRIDGSPVQGQDITLTTTGGTLNGLATVVLATDDDGEVEATLSVPSQFTCPGTVTVTASTSAAPCNEQYTDSNVVRVLCQQPASVDVFFCIDTTDSMTLHDPTESVVSFCQDASAALAQRGVPLRLAGLKFSKDTGEIEPSQIVSLASAYSLPQFISFLRYPYWPGSGLEMQWTALTMAAQDLMLNAGSGRVQFVVILTDEDVGNPAGLTRNDVELALSSAVGAAFFSLWEVSECDTSLHSFYGGLNVHGGRFDAVDWWSPIVRPGNPETFWPLRLLRAAVAGLLQ